MSCDYEAMRLLNIQRNKQMLKQLGFGNLVKKIKLNLKNSPKKQKKLKKNSQERKSKRIQTKIEKKQEKLSQKRIRRKIVESDESEKENFIFDEQDFIVDETSFILDEEEEEEEKEIVFEDETIIDFSPTSTKSSNCKLNESYIEDSDIEESASQFSKPIIMFTGIPNFEKYEKPIKKLGGKIETENISKVTHLISENIKRTSKFLCAISNGCNYFLTLEWLENSIEKKFFVDETFYFIEDIETESKYDFLLKYSISFSSQKKLFDGFKFFITPNAFPDIFELKKIITYAGGKTILEKNQVTSEMIHLIVISSHQDKDFCRKLPFLPRLNFHTSEFILDSVLKQQMNPKRHLLKI
jgi:hypothetical protein